MQQQLTELSLDYIDGKIERDAYRTKRRALIEQHLFADSKRQIQPKSRILQNEIKESFALDSNILLNRTWLTALPLAAALLLIIVVSLFDKQSGGPVMDHYEQLMADNRWGLDEAQQFMAKLQQSSPEQQQQWLENARQKRHEYANSTKALEKAKYDSLTALLIEVETKQWEDRNPVAERVESSRLGDMIASRVNYQEKDTVKKLALYEQPLAQLDSQGRERVEYYTRELNSLDNNKMALTQNNLHVIKKGDDLSELLANYNLSKQQAFQLNPRLTKSLQVGGTIKVAGDIEHKVKRGEHYTVFLASLM